MRRRRIVLDCFAARIRASTLGGCSTFDPTEWFNTKKPLPGERKAMFPDGVPGVPQGVPPELVEGYQPPPEPPPTAGRRGKAEAKPKPKPRPKQAAAPRAAAPAAAAAAAGRRLRSLSRPFPIRRRGADPARV